MIERNKRKHTRRKHGTCEECGWYARLNPIYAKYAADIAQWLCDACKTKRQTGLVLMWSGE
jgi:hypothetical protein